jgi:Omp85 superfamily domain
MIRRGGRTAWFGYGVMLAIGAVAFAPHRMVRAQQTNGDSADVSQGTASPRNTLVPLPVVFYQTETGLGFGATVGYFFPMGPDATQDTSARRQSSSVSLIGVYTLKKQIITSLRTELYPAGGQYRILAEGGFIRFPTKFWGIGNETPDSNEEDYTPDLVNLAFELQTQISSGWYVGLVGQTGHRVLKEVEAGGLLDGGQIPGAENGSIIGVGLLVSRDTRSSTIYPTRGSYHQFKYLLYDGFFGSSYDFGTLSLDLRKYVPLGSRRLLAFRALGVVSPGSPPFDLMPQLGGDVLLRGYFAGRYRDRDLVAFQGEYRTRIWWRIGATVFGGVGQVSYVLRDLTFTGFHPSAGAGLRFLLSPDEGLNIRADYGYGFDAKSTGFYLGIGEVF